MSVFKKGLFINPVYNKISSVPLRIQLYFWITYFSFNVLRWGNFYQDYIYSFKSNLIGFPIHIILCYLFIFIFLPKLFQGKIFEFFGYLALSLGITLILKFELTYYFINTDVLPEFAGITSKITFDYAIQTILGEVYVITFVTAIKLIIDWMKQRDLLAKNNKILLENELKYLRSQIQPHFFFNTLNNLYSLAIDKSEKTPDIILKLSDLMKYFLYETGKKFQELNKEVMHIKNYIEIEKLRYNENLKINFKIEGEIKKVRIIPLLLIPLVENAFKHGVRNCIGHSYIHIDLIVDKNSIYFAVENSMSKPNTKLKEQIGGIGLSNIKKRLDLNYGKGNYQLKTFEEKNKHIAQLNINLAK